MGKYEEAVNAALEATKIRPILVEPPMHDAGASEEELQVVRRSMLDGDPDTYWQIEASFQIPELKGFSANADGNEVPSESLDELQKKVKSYDPGDFGAIITVDMKRVIPVNWISLLPANFQEGNWLQVLSISTSVDGNNFEPLSDLGNMNETTLTPEANEDLSELEAAGVLTQGKNFAGHGLWAFSERSARYVRFTLRQILPMPAPYTVYTGLIERDVSVARDRERREKNKHTYTNTEIHIEEPFELNYERSILLHGGTFDVQTLFKDLDKLSPSLGYEKGEAGQVATIRHRGKQHKDTTVISASDWQCTDKVEIPKFDRARYVIGIRDIEINRYTFVGISSFASTIWEFPNPVMKVALEADEMIPPEFRQLDPKARWIKYFVSFDDITWHPIAPLAPTFSHAGDEIVIPQVINVNSEVPKEDRNPVEGYIAVEGAAHQARMKFVLTRPSGEDYETLTPILKSYKLKAFLRGDIF